MDLNEDDVIRIIRLLDESDFNELRLQIGDLRIVVNRSGSVAPLPGVDQPIVAPEPPTAPSPGPAPRLPVEEPTPEPSPVTDELQLSVEAPDDGGRRVTITSPMLGTFYRAPAPGEPPFVEVGTVVEQDTTVCIIEVMKLFTTIKAERRGRVTRVSVEDGQLVEYGQVLFQLEPEAAGEVVLS